MSDAGSGPPPGVSVVVPHFGDPAPTSLIVRLLSAQDYDGPVDVVVVDDCSPEPLPPLSGASVIRNAVNSGFGYSANRGAEVARAHPFVLFLNSDCEPGPDFLGRLVAAATPRQPAVCGVDVVSDPPVRPVNRFPTVMSVMAPRSAALRPLLRRSPALRRQLLDPPAPDDSRTTDWVSGAALLVPRAEFLHVGGFDEDYFMYWEDVDLQFRLREIGVPAVWLDQVTVRHRGGASSSEDQRRSWGLESEFIYFAKRGHGRRLRAAYRLLTWTDFGYDLVRRAAGRPTTPTATLRHRRTLLRETLAGDRYASARGGRGQTRQPRRPAPGAGRRQ